MRDGPPDHPALIQFRKLAGPRDHAESIYDDRHIKGMSVFLAGRIRNQLA